MKGLGSPYNALFSCNGKKVLKYPYFHIFPHFCADLLHKAIYGLQVCGCSADTNLQRKDLKNLSLLPPYRPGAQTITSMPGRI